MISGGIKCCYGCAIRSKGCHAVCEEYAAEKAENDKKREERRKYNRTVLDSRYEKNAKIKRKIKQRK